MKQQNADVGELWAQIKDVHRPCDDAILYIERLIEHGLSAKDIFAMTPANWREWVQENFDVSPFLGRDNIHEDILISLLLEYNDNPIIEMIVAELTGDEVVLAKLCKSKNGDTRRFIAEHRNDKIRRLLLRDPNPTVRTIVAQCTDDDGILAELADDEDDTVRFAVAERVLNKAIAMKLAKDKNPYVRSRLAGRTSDKDVHYLLASDEVRHVREKVAAVTPYKSLHQKFLHDDDKRVRMMMARYNTYISYRDVVQLTHDKDEWVKERAGIRLKGMNPNAKSMAWEG